MSSIAFEFGVLEVAQCEMKKLIYDWNGIEKYQEKLDLSLRLPLEEWRLCADEPYGHSYVQDARQCIVEKIVSLECKKEQWVAFLRRFEQFIQFVKDADEKAACIFRALAQKYTDYQGVAGTIRVTHDMWYKVWGVTIVNSHPLTRWMADRLKRGKEKAFFQVQKVNDWFRHEEGRYLLNIAKSISLTGAAIAGMAVAILAIPFTGGSSTAIAVGCIGAVASGIVALISGINSYCAVLSNRKALDIKNRPGVSRFYGTIEDYSDFVRKRDYGTKRGNDLAKSRANFLKTTYSVSEIVSFAASAISTFGLKTVQNKEITQLTIRWNKKRKPISVDLKKMMKELENGFKLARTGVDYLKASNRDRTEIAIQAIAKTNRTIKQIDKYFFKVDVTKKQNQYYIGGDGMKKLVELWNILKN